MFICFYFSYFFIQFDQLLAEMIGFAVSGS